MQSIRIGQTERSIDNTEAYRNSQNFISRENLRLREAEQKARVKSDGPKVSVAPNSNELNAASDPLIQRFFGGVMPIENSQELMTLRAMEQDIASRAKQIVADRKGMTYATAVNLAITEAEASGDMKPVTIEGKGWFGKDRSAPGYNPRGRSEADPLPVPKDASKLIPGRFYKSNGQVKQFNP